MKNKTTHIKLNDGSDGFLKETDNMKLFSSEDYKYIFNKESGLHIRWGKTMDDDGDLSLGVPEIADIEISTICGGVDKVCKFCYKSNIPIGENMSLETFKKVFAKLPPTVTQIAFGIGDIDGNPDMWDIFDYARENGVIPNVTINGVGITDEVAEKLASKCGGVAVSVYNKELSYDAIKKLTDLGLGQVNIHAVVAEERFDFIKSFIDDQLNDKRLEKMKAIVFLAIKPKGRGKKGFTKVTDERFKELVDYALDSGARIGFDSCSAFRFLKAVKDRPNYKVLEQGVEPCEAAVYSSYINVKGEYFPCSFLEGVEGWEEGISVVDAESYMTDVWRDKRTDDFRGRVIKCRSTGKACPHYKCL